MQSSSATRVHYQATPSGDGGRGGTTNEVNVKEGGASPSSEVVPRVLSTPSSVPSSTGGGGKPTTGSSSSNTSRGSNSRRLSPADPNNTTVTYTSPTKDDVKNQAFLARMELEKSMSSNNATKGSSSNGSSSSSSSSTSEDTTVASPSVGSSSPSATLSAATLASGELSPTFDCTKGLKFSKFTGFYSPTYSAAFSSKNRESPKHVDPELMKLLKTEFDTENVKLHKKKDWMKTYSDEAVKYAACARNFSGGSASPGKD